jgi:hypothetical protein
MAKKQAPSKTSALASKTPSGDKKAAQKGAKSPAASAKKAQPARKSK